MKVRKRVFSVLCAGVLTFTLALMAGCGEKTYNLNEEALANSLLEKIEFDCTMYQVQDENISDFLSIEGAEKQILYMGNGAYADSVGIFTLADESAAKEAMTTVEGYLADLKDSFQDYLPEEAAEIDSAAAVQKGRYVVFCVSPDAENALSLIEESITEGDSQELSSPERDTDVSGDNTGTESGNENDGDKDGGNNSSGKNNVVSDNADTVNKAVGDYPSVEANGKFKSYGNVVRIGDTGFELYSYTESGAEKYASVVNRTAKALKDTADVYEVLVPLSSGVTLPDEYFGEIKSSNQRKSLDKIIEKAAADVKVVDMYDNLMQHRDEYIYFRTDHHWTALGAYYGYERFCEEKGVLPITLERRESANFGDFLGSFYQDTDESKKMEKNPDTMQVYYPISDGLSLRYTNQQGNKGSWEVIHDVSDYPVSIKYSTFIAGDNPYTRIKNESLPDGETCVVVKESFGNAFVPYLADHYSKIYVIDYRYWEGNLIDFAKEKKADDVIFVNNLSMIRSDYLTGRLSQIVEK